MRLLNIILICCFFSCSTKKNDVAIGKLVLVDTAASSAYFTKNALGETVICRIAETSSGKRVLFSVVEDDGNISQTITVSASDNVYPHGENTAKVAFKHSGEIIAVWGAANADPRNQYAGLVFYSQSFDNGKSWSEKRRLVNDTSGYDQRYFDIALLEDDEVGIVWLDNRKQTPAEGSALFFSKTYGKSGFSNEAKITEPCCQCCRTAMLVDAKKSINIVYRGIYNDSIRDMMHVASDDGGKSFSLPARISEDNWAVNGCPHTGPAISENNHGLSFAWYSGGTNAGIFYNSTAGKTYTPRDTVTGRQGKHCQITTLNNDIVIVWDESFKSGGNVFTRIGVQQRSADGKTKFQRYITSENMNCIYPSVTATGRNSILVAYTQLAAGKESLFMQEVRFP